jgi:hypothetical protein
VLAEFGEASAYQARRRGEALRGAGPGELVTANAQHRHARRLAAPADGRREPARAEAPREVGPALTVIEQATAGLDEDGAFGVPHVHRVGRDDGVASHHLARQQLRIQAAVRDDGALRAACRSQDDGQRQPAQLRVRAGTRGGETGLGRGNGLVDVLRPHAHRRRIAEPLQQEQQHEHREDDGKAQQPEAQHERAGAVQPQHARERPGRGAEEQKRRACGQPGRSSISHVMILLPLRGPAAARATAFRLWSAGAPRRSRAGTGTGRRGSARGRACRPRWR